MICKELCDFHVHTNFCDGRDEPEEIVQTAITKGVRRLGMVVHSYVPFDPESCASSERTDEFLHEVAMLKENYAGKIEIFCGIEMDLFSKQDPQPFDYVIGSVHYLRHGKRYKAVDDTPEILKEMVNSDYNGDFYACAEDYFAATKQLLELKPDIIGHFDLIKKFSGDIPFDPKNARYRAAWRSAADVLLQSGAVFEINYGGMLRGWTAEPYPSPEIVEYLKSRGAKFVMSSDAHRKEDVAEFPK